MKKILPKKSFISWHIISILLIILSGIFVYANSINGKFIWDDEIQILDNNEIRSWNNLPHLFVENVGTGAGRDYNFYRPLHVLSLMSDYSLWKLDPRGWHCTNIVLHILTAICLYALANLLFSNNVLSLLTALFFVVHPIHTEVVSYINGRGDSLSALFMLLCLIFYIKTPRIPFISILLGLTCFILALLSRENALTIPFLILLYYYMFGGFKFKDFLPLAAIFSIYIALRLTVLYFPAPPDQMPTTLLERIPGFFVAITNYLGLLILPFNLHMEHGDMLFKMDDPKAILGLLIITLAGYSAFKLRKSNKLVTFSILWFFIGLLPQSNLYQINAYMNEHWLYLPSFGFFLILSHYICRAYQTDKLKIPTALFVAGMLIFYSFLTIKQNEYWRDPVNFYERTLHYAPFSSRIYNNLARLYAESGRKSEAVELFKKAILLSPRYAECYNNLGVVYEDLGEDPQAIDALKKAVEIDPGLVGAYSNLGNAYGHAGNYDKAVESLQKALAIKPTMSAYNNLGIIYRDLKENDAAIDSFNKARDMSPDNLIVNTNLADTYAHMSKDGDALKYYQKILDLNGGNANVYNNMGFILKRSGKFNEALSCFYNALRISPTMTVAYENLILTYLKLGDNQKAKEMCDQAIQADPDNEARYTRLLNHIPPP